MAIDNAVWAVTEALTPDALRQGMGWRWGDVVAVNADGTLTVTIGGVNVDSVISTAAVAGASAGDRVLVAYLGSEAVALAMTGTAETTQTLSGTGTNYFHAHGTTATLMSAGTSPSAQWGSATVCTIPEGWRPWTPLYFPCVKDGAIVSDTYLIIAADGTVTVQNAGGTQAARNYWCTATWAV